MKRLYFMRPVGQVSPIKIGCSKFPEGRLEQLAIVSPVRLEIIASIPGDHATERRLHGMFAKHWLHHEWFAASKELLALVDHVVEAGALPELPEGKVVPLPRTRRQRTGYRVRSAIITAKTIERRAAIGRTAQADYENGMTLAALAERHGCSLVTMRHCLVAAGVALRRYTMTRPKGLADQARASEFQRRRRAGETLQQIGDAHGITRERVRQVLNKAAA